MKMLKFYILLLFCLFSMSYGNINAIKPNIIMFLTDDQDIVMNGMVSRK